jgi:hypothetical protein
LSFEERGKTTFQKRPNISSNSISSFISTKEPFKKEHMQQNFFGEDLNLLFVKNHLLFQFVKSNWLKSMHLCPRIFFRSRKSFFHELVGKNQQLYVLLSLTECHFVTSSFDLWMSKVRHDVFALVINILGVD